MIKTRARLNPIHRSRGEHCHPFPQLLLGLRGTTDCEFKKFGCGISTEQIAVVPQYETHFFAGKHTDSELLVVDLNIESLAQNRRAEPISAPLLPNGLFEEPRFIWMSEELRKLTVHAASQLARMSTHADILAYQWATLLTVQTHMLLNTTPITKSDERINFDRLIDSRLASPPTNLELQSRLGMGSTRLNSWAHQKFGVTPQQRVLERRLQWARHWLAATDKPIGNIAQQLGFCDSSALTNACRRVFGVTPSQIRHEKF